MWKRGNWRQGFGQRFGRFSNHIKQAVTNSHVVWIHGVSVGEVNMAIQLVRKLEPIVPHVRFVVSTTTTTGMGELRRQLPTHVLKIYYPADRNKWVSRALGTLRPELVILMEAEIWPNFLWSARRRGIPCVLLNARVSERSYRGYRRMGFLFRDIFASFSAVSAQTETDKERLIDLGCRPDAVQVFGSLKFESKGIDQKQPVDVDHILKQCGVTEDSLVLLGGSTHPGEEKILAEIYQHLKSKFPKLFLVLVPRHAERGKTVGGVLESAGLKFAYRNQMFARTRYNTGELDCLLVNTTGELRFFYEFASVVFVGGSITTPSGQNPIEPASLGKPILFGPGMKEFSYIVKPFLENKAAIEITDQQELETQIARLLGDANLRKEYGEKALAVVEQNKGALGQTIDLIASELAKVEVH